MNLEQAKLLAKIGNHILTVEDRFIRPVAGISSAKYEETWGGCAPCSPYPGCGCLINHAYRARIVPDIYELDMGDGFANHFGVTWDEATDVIYHKYLGGDTHRSTARNYHTAVKDLLTKYGYAHLLEPEEVIPVREIKPAYKDHLTPAEKGFDWRNFARQPQQTRADE